MTNIERAIEQGASRVIIDGRGVGLSFADAADALERATGNELLDAVDHVFIETTDGVISWPQ